IHWLHVHAQKNRWHEEILLITYEMQWTVHYFWHEFQKWHNVTCQLAITPGALAYANCKAALWKGYAVSANKAFR
ncbi:hypothetical protein CPB84DRAFT_1650166, partial [Gymnopilus junonius]